MTARRRRRGRGGQGGWEPRPTLRDRQRQVLTLETEGLTQDEIAHRLGITQPAVSKILARVDARLTADLTAVVAAQRARQIRHLLHVHREALKAWERSKADVTRRSQRTRSGAGAGGADTTAEIVVATRHGDPRYLSEALKAMAEVRALLGVQVPPAAGPDPWAHLPDAELEALARAQHARLTGRDDAADD